MTPDILAELAEAQRANRPVALATRLPDGAQRLLPDASAGAELNAAAEHALARDESGTVKVGGADWFLLVHNPPVRLIVVGAVHIAQALVPFASQVGFAVTVVDPRRSFASDERFPDVVVRTDWPDEAMDTLRPDTRTAVVTLTHDPKLDDPALDRALRSPAFYIGALGSAPDPRRAPRASAGTRARRGGPGPHQGPGRTGHRGGDGAGDRAVDCGRARGGPPGRRAGAEAGGVNFGAVPLEEAEGAILAHTQRLGARTLRKGTLLDKDAVSALREAGLTEIVAARLQPGDVPEDVAADRLAAPLVGPLLSRTRAATGRVNLSADVPGLLRVDAAKVNRINSVDESLTLGTLENRSVVAAKDLVATVKVIPFAVPGPVLSVAEAIAAQGQPALTLHPFKPLKVGLVATELPGVKESVIEKTITVTQQRVERLTGSLLPTRRVPHQESPVIDALRGLLSEGADLLLVVGASAVVDRRDVGPAAIVAVGGEILHFGMPVDPGNLICLGRIGEKPALVLPGCARSPRPNGIDFVLPRLFAGLGMTASDIMALGVGGLLMEAEARGLPREKAPAIQRSGPVPKEAPMVAAVVLAAGRSRRMAPHNKLLIADRAGKPMIARVVDNVLSSKARPILVVTGHQPKDIEHALGGRPVRFAHAEEYAEGLAASLKAGIAAVPPTAAAAIVCLGDMPLVTGRMIDRLLEAYRPEQGQRIVLPTFRGKQGNPMIWDRAYFSEIMQIGGDSGARFLISQHRDAVVEVEMADDAVLRDFDTAESLETLPARLRPEIPLVRPGV